MLNNSVPAELDQIQQVEHASRRPNFIQEQISRAVSRCQISDIRYQELSQEVKYNEVIFCEIKFRVWQAAGPEAWSRAGEEQPAKLEFLDLDLEKHSVKDTPQWVPVFLLSVFRGRTALMVAEICVWFDRVRYFRLLRCCVTTMCPPLIKWDTLN